ncbi:hypothetical protein HA466_0082670 [Hirschfeldia incana]|nr:hypothetical protein HA466_0082670 [Hirschfeldia incana]
MSAEMGVIGLIVGGEPIFPMIGIAHLPAWSYSVRGDRYGPSWLLGNFLHSFLKSSWVSEAICNWGSVSSLTKCVLYIKIRRFSGDHCQVHRLRNLWLQGSEILTQSSIE